MRYVKTKDVFTLLNGYFAVFAVLFLFNGYFVLTALLISLCAVMDLLDGWIARLTKTASDFGGQLDAFADILSFGVVPALFISHVYLGFNLLSMIFVATYVGANFLRQARYMTVPSKKVFGPSNTIIAVFISVFYLSGILVPEWFWYVFFFIASISLVSSLEYPSHKVIEEKYMTKKTVLALCLFLMFLAVLSMKIFILFWVALFGLVILFGPLLAKVIR